VSAPHDAPLAVPLYYDFASSLCYVAHRVLEEWAPAVEALGIDLRWTPLDLAALRGLRRGAPLGASDRAHIATLAGELDVRLRIPRAWLDSRAALAAAAVVPAARAATWRERVWSAIYESGEAPATRDTVRRLGAPLGLALDDARLDAGARAVARQTEEARRREVTGLPAFQLGRWPFGGVHDRDTLLGVLERYARRAREGALSAP